MLAGEQHEIGAEDISRGTSRVKAFADHYAALDATNKTNEKIDALSRYFSQAPPREADWAIHFLIGRRPKAAASADNSASPQQWYQHKTCECKQHRAARFRGRGQLNSRCRTAGKGL
jgi:hypothetical protein